MVGKTIAVTGAASGIGAATATLLKERGATVIGLDQNPTASIVDHYIPINLADESSMASAVAEMERAGHGKIDALCNIAGVPPTVPPALVLQVNFLGLRTFAREYPEAKVSQFVIYCFGNQDFRVFAVD